MPEIKFTVDQKFQQTLTDLVDSNKSADTDADIVQRAVATYKYFRSVPEGAKIQIISNTGDIIVPNVAVP